MSSNIKKKYRNLLLISIYMGILVLLILPISFCIENVPDKIFLYENSEYSLELPLWFSGHMRNQTKEVLMTGESNIPADQIELVEASTYEVRLFGMIPVKKSKVSVVNRCEIMPCGSSVGLYLKSNGLLVVGTAAITDLQERQIEPAKDILKSGDYILSCNDVVLQRKEELVQMLSKSEGSEVVLSIVRNNEKSEVKVKPVKTKSGYQLGIWVRDDVQGIGTVTYITENGNFGALGHPISDSDTGQIFQSCSGSVYQSSIQAIIKGRNGEPGSLSGMILYGPDHYYGTIEKNCATGVFGKIEEEYFFSLGLTPMPVAFSQDVKEGSAFIQSDVSGKLECYEIRITEARNSGRESGKQIRFEVTDKRLLDLTGGIVQGMSGSPILQNGRIVGAVTHVLINDPTKGYGIFIENMLEAAENGAN